MNNKGNSGDEKPVTLADYIPPAAPEPKRRGLSGKDRDRLEALEREMDTDADGQSRKRKRKRKTRRSGRIGGMKPQSFVFWLIIFMLLVAFLVD